MSSRRRTGTGAPYLQRLGGINSVEHPARDVQAGIIRMPSLVRTNQAGHRHPQGPRRPNLSGLESGVALDEHGHMRRARILAGVIVTVLVGASCSRSGGQDSAAAAASTTVVYGSTSAPGGAATPGGTAPAARFDESAGQPPGITVQNGMHASLADQGD